MPSNYTEHYQLSQWEPEDKVLRTDFNADNAKIEAALGALAGATTLQTLQSYTTEADARHYIIDLSGIDWTKWKIVILDIVVAPGTSDQVYFSHSAAAGNKLGRLSMLWNRIIYFPFGQKDAMVTGIFWGRESYFINGMSDVYRYYSKASIHSDDSSYLLKAGTKITISGIGM